MVEFLRRNGGIPGSMIVNINSFVIKKLCMPIGYGQYSEKL